MIAESHTPAISGCTIFRHAQLRARNSFRVSAHTATLIDLYDARAIEALTQAGFLTQESTLILGEGSNVLFTRDWPGAVLTLRTRGIQLLTGTPAQMAVIVRAAAGEHWHDLVEWTLQQGLIGLENLALIPGSVGASPIQNIGAYGVEVGEFIESVSAWDRQAQRTVTLDHRACRFAYRDSLFKHEPSRYIILEVDFRLSTQAPLRLEYAGLREELDAMQITHPAAQDIAAAVVRLRTRKLADPAVIGNAGSFFKNPIVAKTLASDLRKRFPSLPMWPAKSQTSKLSAAWMIEHCDFKGMRDGDAGVASQHALVLVNHGQATGAQIWALAQDIVERVQTRFEVRLEPEPTII